MIEPEYQKWVYKILGFDFEIQYVARRLNRATDALSRRLDLVECVSMVTPQSRDWDKLRVEVEELDELLDHIKKDLSLDISTHARFTLCNGLLLYKDRLVVLRSSSFIPLILTQFHSSPVGGHSGEIKTHQHIAFELYWVRMKFDIAKFVAECEICQRNKSFTASLVGILQPIPLPLKDCYEITMNFIEGLPKVEGCSTILVVVDRLSKYAHFVCLKHPYLAEKIVRLHGLPISIISDRDQIFMSHFWKEIF